MVPIIIRYCAALSLALIFIFLFQACKTQRQVMDSWQGAHKSDLIRSWGPPHDVRSDGRGGKVLIYYQKKPFSGSPGFIKKKSDGSYYVIPATKPRYNRKMFYADEYGRIYYWLIQ